MTTKPYRPCVVAVIKNEAGQVLVGERSDQHGAWQLPQGGIDPGETPEQAVYRELLEEIGTDAVREIERCPFLIRYNFPHEMQRDITKQFAGQEQTWFLFKFKDGMQANLARSDGEFRDFKWLEPHKILEGVIEWKRQAYQQGLKAFALI